MQIKQAIISFHIGEHLSMHYGHYLRGYFANRFSDVLFHNHLGGGRFRYGYPLIQYKIIQGQPIVMGLQHGAELICQHFLDIEQLSLGDRKYEGFESSLQVEDKCLSVASTLKYRYEFYSPWMAFNQENYQKYQQLSQSQENYQEFFQRILVGNILSFAKSLDWWIHTPVFVLPILHPITIHFKGQSMIGFVGHFTSNVELPDFIGLGHSSTRGFGTIFRRDVR